MSTLDLATRDDLANRIAEFWTNNADLKDLEIFYYEAQMQFLSELPDDELLQFAKDNDIQ